MSIKKYIASVLFPKAYKGWKSRTGTRNSSNRRDWIENTLKKIPSGHRILDAGAGERQYMPFCKHLEYVSQDFGQYHGSHNHPGFQTGQWNNEGLDILSDIVSIPAGDASFDAVMCTEVFEHIPKPLDAIREFNRLLKPGGKLIITAPFTSMTHFAPYYFYSGFSKFFYEKHLAELGFEIIDMSFNGGYYDFLAQELRRIESPSVLKKYTKTSKLTNTELLDVGKVLHIIDRLAKEDSSSSELVCFGIHVLAKKIG